MNSKSDNEFAYWEECTKDLSTFFKNRELDWEDFCCYLPGLSNESGIGLDFGSGAFSVLEFSDLNYVAYDPLMSRYKTLVNTTDNYQDTLPDDIFDWILCVNVVDHDPNPEVILDYVYNHLKDGGKFYFQVQFDSVLYPTCHYSLWDEVMVEKYTINYFKTLHKEDELRPQYNQIRHWVVFEKDVNI